MSNKYLYIVLSTFIVICHKFLLILSAVAIHIFAKLLQISHDGLINITDYIWYFIDLI